MSSVEGLVALLHELKAGKVEKVLIHEGDCGQVISKDHLGYKDWLEAAAILDQYTLEREFKDDWTKMPPAIMIILWAENMIIRSHDYDHSLDLRWIERNPPRE